MVAEIAFMLDPRPFKTVISSMQDSLAIWGLKERLISEYLYDFKYENLANCNWSQRKKKKEEETERVVRNSETEGVTEI